MSGCVFELHLGQPDLPAEIELSKRYFLSCDTSVSDRIFQASSIPAGCLEIQTLPEELGEFDMNQFVWLGAV
jgi:hypothetical protein